MTLILACMGEGRNGGGEGEGGGDGVGAVDECGVRNTEKKMYIAGWE